VPYLLFGLSHLIEEPINPRLFFYRNTLSHASDYPPFPSFHLMLDFTVFIGSGGCSYFWPFSLILHPALRTPPPQRSIVTPRPLPVVYPVEISQMTSRLSDISLCLLLLPSPILLGEPIFPELTPPLPTSPCFEEIRASRLQTFTCGCSR